jgi:hypothetical protein
MARPQPTPHSASHSPPSSASSRPGTTPTSPTSSTVSIALHSTLYKRLSARDHLEILNTYQPAGRFWAFQGIEAGIFLVLAAALIAVTFRLVLARDA